jgi:hypothetical protein
MFRPAAESIVRVQGKVDAEPVGSICNLEVFRENAKNASAKAEVHTAFSHSFTIAPGFHRYYFIMTCRDVPGRYQSAVFTLGGTRYVDPPLDLGTIKLTR